ncbi:flavodoxin family protein [Orenia marismortui]|uniref:Multimeric flavodoxin WrbA n=1 Tax=Orenia marismortui TaxID=46469 RepID=A0A4R8H014_9FIRM|nr:flavodoxin family protein [Orenia marismortui]TDX51051.1 multimeric flavodoxin WrbA [Orenia marismortui]
MRILGINGSPNPDGNTVVLLNKALEAANKEGVETKLIHVNKALSELKVPFCRQCSSPCSKACYEGTLLEDYYKLLAEADGIIIGSPVYFGTVTAQLKAFWDMTRDLRTNKALLNKIGATITVGASRYGGQETTVSTLQDMMLIQGMIIVGDGSEDTDAGHQGACGQKPTISDEAAHDRASILGKRVARLIKKV